MEVKGKMILIGGAIKTEYAADVTGESKSLDILSQILLKATKGIDSRIEIVTVASDIKEASFKNYRDAFFLRGAKNCRHLVLNNKSDVMSKEATDRLDLADILFFTGGDQLKIISTIGGTHFHKKLIKRYRQDDFLYVGTSAGAAAVSATMIYSGENHEALRKGMVEITGGLGLIDSLIIDTHFLVRGRVGRLFQSVVGNPMKVGIGLGEDTAVIITDGKDIEVVGSGSVMVIDGHEVDDTNLSRIAMNEPMSAKRLITHVLSRGDKFDLKTCTPFLKISQFNEG